MFELALRTPQSHQQFFSAEGTLALAHDEHGWRLEPQHPALQITQVGHELRVVSHCPLIDSGTLTLPARWKWGSTELEARAVAECRREVAGLTPLETHCGELLRNGKFRGPSTQTLTKWYEALAGLHNWSPGDAGFLPQVANLLLDPVGLDGAFCLSARPRKNVALAAGAFEWQIVASARRHDRVSLCFNRELIERLAEEPVTWLQPMQSGRRAADREAAVLAPLRNNAGELCGALYGVRVTHGGNGRRGVRYLEAHQVQSLADQVSLLVNRFEQEQTTARQQALLEQAFTPHLAQALQHEPELLSGTEREVTVLMADLRDFSGLCAALGPQHTYEFLGQLMNVLTDVILAHDGTVIDYYGDGLAAMWNAPCDQSHHAELACRAALALQAALPPLETTWRGWLTAPLKMGVGVHTGAAIVGNAGSRRKLKYGPRGMTVNIASRIEHATKRLGAPVVISAATHAQLVEEFPSRRLCRARLRGVPQPLELFALEPSQTPCATAL